MKAVQLLTVLVLLSTSAMAQLRPQRKTTKVEKGHNATTPEMVHEQVASKDSSPKMTKKTKSAGKMDKQKYTKSARSKPAPTPTPPSANCDPATDLECDDP
jgi:hypothetical protein